VHHIDTVPGMSKTTTSKRSRWLVPALVAAAVTAIACGASPSSGGNPNGPGVDTGDDSPAATSHTIVLQVTGAKGVSKADITYGVDVDTSQDNGAKVPWKKTIKADDYFAISILAQNMSSSTATITCQITVDGKVVKKNSSKGEYAIATCTAP